jgi:hypothetical protein
MCLGPGRIVDVFQRIRAATEKLIAFAEKQSVMLTFLHRNLARTERAKFFSQL